MSTAARLCIALCGVIAAPVRGAVATSRRAPPLLGRARPSAPARGRAQALLSPAVLATSTGAVAELAVSAGLGYAAVKTGLIERAGLTQLARIVYNFLLPIFLLTSVLRTVMTYGISRGMLALPLVSAIQIACGLTIATLMLRALGIAPGLRSSRRFIACAAFGNTGVLPLALTEALFRAPYGDASVLPRAASYLSFYLLGWSPIFWSLGKAVLTGGDEEGAEGAEPRWRQLARRVISPPIIGALSGLAVGLACPVWALESPRSPLRVVLQALCNLAHAYPPAALLVLAGSLAGGAAPKGDASAAAAAAQPAASADGAAGIAPAGTAQRELGTPAMILGISACRFVLSPLIACGLVSVLRALRVIPAVSADPVLTFVLLLNSAMPPAQNSVLILQVAGDQQGSTQMSRILFGMYALSAVPVALLLSVFLQRVGL